MIHKRIITIAGDTAWVKRTLENSLPEGFNVEIFGPDRQIIVETIEGDPIEHELPSTKPESRFNINPNAIIRKDIA